MEISKKQHGSTNPKTEKTYSLDFKKRTVEYYLLGMYDEQTIWKKLGIIEQKSKMSQCDGKVASIYCQPTKLMKLS